MARNIEDLTDRELHNFINSYKRENKTEGGIFSLAELHVERLSRLPSARAPREIMQFIIENAPKSSSGTVTYGEVWGFFNPGVPWRGNHSIKVVGGSLGKLIAYCVKNGLPLVSTLVVQSGTRRLSDRAIQNIYDDAKLYGLNVGFVPKEFVSQQAEIARQINANTLP